VLVSTPQDIAPQAGGPQAARRNARSQGSDQFGSRAAARRWVHAQTRLSTRRAAGASPLEQRGPGGPELAEAPGCRAVGKAPVLLQVTVRRGLGCRAWLLCHWMCILLRSSVYTHRLFERDR